MEATETSIQRRGWARYGVIPLASTPDGELLAILAVSCRTAVRFRPLPRSPAGLGTARRADESWLWSLLLVVLLLAVPYAVGWAVIVVWLLRLIGELG